MSQTPRAQVHLITHPLVQHKLTLMRNKQASSTSFRTLLGELAMLMAYEVTRDMPTHLVQNVVKGEMRRMGRELVRGALGRLLGGRRR